MLKNPRLLLAERFPSVIDSIIDEMRGDLKPKADALIREAVSGIEQRFSDVSCAKTQLCCGRCALVCGRWCSERVGLHEFLAGETLCVSTGSCCVI
jgi:hypothetical protein